MTSPSAAFHHFTVDVEEFFHPTAMEIADPRRAMGFPPATLARPSSPRILEHLAAARRARHVLRARVARRARAGDREGDRGRRPRGRVARMEPPPGHAPRARASSARRSAGARPCSRIRRAAGRRLPGPQLLDPARPRVGVRHPPRGGVPLRLQRLPGARAPVVRLPRRRTATPTCSDRPCGAPGGDPPRHAQGGEPQRSPPPAGRTSASSRWRSCAPRSPRPIGEASPARSTCTRGSSTGRCRPFPGPWLTQLRMRGGIRHTWRRVRALTRRYRFRPMRETVDAAAGGAGMTQGPSILPLPGHGRRVGLGGGRPPGKARRATWPDGVTSWRTPWATRRSTGWRVDADGAPQGVLPLVHVRSRLFGNYLLSMPFLNDGGPLGPPEARAALGRSRASRRRGAGGWICSSCAGAAPVPGDAFSTSERKLTV